MAATRAPQRNGVIYGRQSKTKDGSASIAVQTAACRKVAKQFKVNVVTEIIEPPSTSAFKGRGRTRPRFPELLELVRSGTVEVVIVYMTDRLSRGGGPGWAPLWDAVEECVEETGVERDLDRFVLTPDGYKSEFELGIRATMDREESKKTSERLLDMKERHATEGRVGGGGRRPFGYEDDKVTIRESEAEVLREIVDRYLAGEGCRALARWLNDAGHKSAMGKLWTGGVVLNTIKNPRIAGLRVHRGAVLGDASWPGVIDRPTWDRLAARVAENARGPGQPKTSKYLLQQVVTCSRCGGRMAGAPTEGKPRYRCQAAPGKVNCGSTTILASAVDNLVTDMLLFRLDSPVVADALAGRTRPAAADDEDLSGQILTLEARIDEASKMFADGEIDRKDLVTIRRRVEDELLKLRRRIARTEQVVTIENFLKDGPDLATMWADLPQGRKQQIIRAVIDRVLIHPAKTRGSKTVDLGRIEVCWRV